MTEERFILYKTADQAVKAVEELNPLKNEKLDSQPTSTIQPDANKIPLVFGTTLVDAVPIYKIDGPKLHSPETNTKIIFYALSASTPVYGDNSFLRDIYVDGKLVQGMRTIDPTTNKIIPYSATVDWRTGVGIGGALNTPHTGSHGGNRFYFGSNIYCQYVKAGEDFTTTSFYQMFSDYKDVNGNRKYGGILAQFDLIKDFPKNDFFDMLVVFYKFNKIYFSSEKGDVKVQMTRLPRFKTGVGDNPRSMRTLTVGNCIAEILDDPNWGMGLTDADYAYNDFRDVGTTMNGSYSITDKPLIEIVKQINNEHYSNMVYEQEGQLRYGSTNATGKAITDDNIIGDIEVEYVDATVAPTKLIAEYNSLDYGTTTIEIGTDETNVVNIQITTANNLLSAKAIAYSIWYRLNNTITVRFKADRSMQQFCPRDKLGLSTTVFSADITIREMTKQTDYTYDVVAEANLSTAVPEPRLKNRTPVIQIGENFFKPPDQEPVPEPTEPGNPDDETPLPIRPTPIQDYRTISGLNFPYNHFTASNNEDWYLGGTTAGTDADPQFDDNGLRVRFVPMDTGAVYQVDYSLIKRDQAGANPTAIECVVDIAIGPEQANELVGFKYGVTRYDYPRFFESIMETARYNQNSSWLQYSRSWPSVFKQKPVYNGAADDPYHTPLNSYDYLYQTQDLDGAGFVSKARRIHILSNNNVFLPRNKNFVHATPQFLRSSVYRLHFTAIYGDVRSPNSVEYIGSTTLFGDERSIQAADEQEAKATAQIFGQTFTPNPTTPPSRSIS